jgi:2,4-dienoyl-CoA reductase (NADPH2)
MLDLVHDGNTMQEVITVAKALEKAGMTLAKYRDWLA